MFFIFWTGWGFLVPVILGLGFMLTQIILNAIFGPYTYEDAEWPKIFATILVSVSIWFVGRYFNGKPGKVMIDKKTGQEIVFKSRNALFFIPMEYWAFIVGIFFLLISFTK